MNLPQAVLKLSKVLVKTLRTNRNDFEVPSLKLISDFQHRLVATVTPEIFVKIAQTELIMLLG